jgi:hypothetical protein
VSRDKQDTPVRLSAATRQRAEAMRLPTHGHNLRAFPFIRRGLLLLFSYFAHDRELATLHQSFSVVPPTMYSITCSDHDC